MSQIQKPTDLMSNEELVMSCWYSFKHTHDLMVALRNRVSKGKFKTAEDKKKVKGFYAHICTMSKDLQMQYDLMSLMVNQFDDSATAKQVLTSMKEHLTEYEELFSVLDDSLSHQD